MLFQCGLRLDGFFMVRIGNLFSLDREVRIRVDLRRVWGREGREAGIVGRSYPKGGDGYTCVRWSAISRGSKR